MTNTAAEHGLAEARRLLWSHDARVRLRTVLDEGGFLADQRITAVHVDDTLRADRAQLTGFDRRGRSVLHDMFYIDDQIMRPVLVPEFDHAFTRMPVPAASELEQAVASESGWIVDMSALRVHDVDADLGTTRHDVFVALLRSMVADGEVTGFDDSGCGAA